jgi:uncharacterized protein
MKPNFKYTNRLAHEISPYLHMHAHNPVDWYPWTTEALDKAKQENKPILLSIGYTACHWCHVMAHESFEDEETAQLMNKWFINIKVDREERPDLDKIYQLSYQLLTQQPGGWPLTIFLTPDKHIPFFAGTYFPKEHRNLMPSFKEILKYVRYLYDERREEIIKQNISFTGLIDKLYKNTQTSASQLDLTPLSSARDRMEQEFDWTYGGFYGAPKFPLPNYLQLLFNYWMQTKNNNEDKIAFEMSKITLERMAKGGIYDQLSAGFFRYSTDGKWEIPHFEKMLYDNAQLLFIYTEMLTVQDNALFRNVVTGTAQWILDEMQYSGGGYFATLAADSEGVEGKFYTWSQDEAKAILSPDEYLLISLYYGLNMNPNFENHWHLYLASSTESVAEKMDKSVADIVITLKSAQQKLIQARKKRIRPFCDTKIIVSWNGLTIKAFALAGCYLQSQELIRSAQKTVDFIRDHLWQRGRLCSIYKDGNVSQPANLDDYVFLSEGILYLLQANWRNHDFAFLLELMDVLLSYFEDKKSGGFYFTASDHEALIYRPKQFLDDAVPSSNAVATQLLIHIGYLTGESKYLLAAERALKNAYPHFSNSPESYSSFLNALELFYVRSQIIILRGNRAEMSKWQELAIKYYKPTRLCFAIPSEETDLPVFLQDKPISGFGTIAYHCHGYVCCPPITNILDFENELRCN